MEAQGGSEILQTERERIRREILELEQRLGVGAIEDLGGKESAGYYEEEAEEAECIQLVEASLREASPQVPDSISDDEGDDLPEDPETCLQMNLVYQEVIVEKLQDLELLLKHNKEQQAEIMCDLAGQDVEKSKTEKGQSSMFLGHFLKPYFRDKVTGLGPPANHDTKEKARQGIKSFEEFLITSWKQREKDKLTIAVANDSIQRLLQPKLLRLENLNKKLDLSCSENQTNVLMKQIAETEREMEEINQMTQRQLLGNRFDDHDWIKISNIDFDGSRKAEDIKNVWQNSEHPSINKEQWSGEETQQLIEIAEGCGCVDWEWIASELKTNRTAYMCLQKYQEYNKDLKKKEWTKEEDQMLTELVQKMRVGNFIPYTKIAYFMEGRNASQILFHWSKSLDPTLKRGPWSRAEDRLLLKAVAKYGSRDWFKIQEEIPGRVDSQCRDRYMNGLNRNVRKGKWTEEEENTFKSLLEKHGIGKWTKIAAELPGRTGTQCMSKWKVMTSVKYVPQQGTRKRKRKRQRWDSSSEESSEDSDEDDRILEELEQDEDDEQEEDEEEEQEVVQKVERKKLKVKQEKLTETIVLDVDRWIPVVENDQQTAEKSTNFQAENTAIGQPVNNWNTESQSCRGRPRSSKIWRIFSKPTSPIPSVGETSVRPAESVSSELTVVPEPDPPPKIAPCLTANDAQQEPPQSQRDAKRARRRLAAAYLSEKNLDRSLLAEVSRWTTARPLVRRQIDVLREALEATGLNSTSVFVLLLQVFRIDKERCLQIIKDKTNKATESLPASKSEDKSRVGPYLNEVKGTTIDVGNGQTMEMTRFKLSAEPLREKPKTVQQLLSERRRAGVSAKASRPTPKPVVIPRPLIIHQPLRLTLLPQPAASSKAPVGPGPQLTQQPNNLPPVQTEISRIQTRSATGSTVKQVVLDKPVSGTQELSSGPPKGQGGPTMTPSPHTSQVRSSAVVKPVNSLGTASASNAASVHPAAAGHRGRRLQPIAPAPQPVINSPLMVPLMLPNSTVPIMALVTPQGLLYIPPGTVMGPPSQNSPAVVSQAGTTVVTTVPLGGANSSMSSATATQVPLSSLSAPSQSVNGGPSVAPVQTISIATPVSAQPLNSPSLAVCRLIPPSASSTQVQPTQTPAPVNCGASAPSLMSANSATLSAVGHVDPSVPTPPSTAQLDQGSGCSRLAADSPSIGSSCTQPSTLTHPEGTKLPATQLQSDKTSIDFKLLCDNKDPITKQWLDGEGGVRVPGTQTTLPYLPPFASTLRGFSNLLLHKKVLEQNLPACEAADADESIDPKKRLEAARLLVNKRLQNNPAYQLLKARFLSIFTLPAFLATLPPKGTLTTIGSLSEGLNQDSTEESEYTETDVESEEDTEGLPEHCVTDEGTNRELNQPFEIPSDLSFGCDLLGSLDTIVEDESNPGPSNAAEVSSTPEDEIQLPTRRSHRLRKNP
ncbi:snRNA-activating protein complex subunit 4 isoform X3 [Mobula hypostoma]|uniref:snRNA-activating protein complex subunit 4 isoform X3 n=1 Tax=Mobula hypostoma TaxID=723540 RepID=UPI002FC3C9AB